MTAIFLITLLALVLNIPLGYFRNRSRKFSARWFIYLHISIPVIVAARILSQTDYRFIPLFILAAVTGQYVGGRMELHL